MNQRIISMILCVTLLVGNLLPIASAEEITTVSTDDIVVENSALVTEPAETEAATEPVDTTVPAETVVETQPQSTEAVEEETTAPETTVPETDVFEAPDCDCGSQSALIIGHSDVCAMKQFYKELCVGTASDVYALWNEIPKNAQAYIMTYLGYAQPETLKELVFLLASKWESKSGLSGVAAAIKDGTLFGAFGIPEDAVLQIKDAAAEAKSAIEAFVAQQENVGKELFTWDISVLNGEGISWQPDGSVRVELELPGEKLHKYTQVYVVHVDDEGNAEKIEAEVIDGNKIAFNTHGFSTFAGYTVDFEYNGVPFSIPGESEIMLSELMDQLKMPFEVTDVADVAFTNYDLIAIEKQADGDWKLTSLQAFKTTEKLTLTMVDGQVYVITVTDADIPGGTYNWHVYNKWNNNTYNHVYCKDGFPGSSNTSAAYNTSRQNLVFDNDNQVTVINLQPKTTDVTQLIIDEFPQFSISNGASVTIQVDPNAACGSVQEIVIQDFDATALFYVTNGSLTIKGRSDVRIVIDTRNQSDYSSIYMIDNAKSLYLEHVCFRNTSKAAIRLCGNEMSSVTIKNCYFESTVSNAFTGGGAIFVSDIYHASYSNDLNDVSTYEGMEYTDIETMLIENCTFNGTKTTKGVDSATLKGGYGGAIGIFGKVFDLDIKNSHFVDCTANCGGGAISIAGSAGLVDITGCEFTRCKALSFHGGAIQVMTRRVTFIDETKKVGSYTRINTLNIGNCTFTGCEADKQYGGGIGTQAQIHTMTITGSSFSGCKAASGGAVSLGTIDLSQYGTTINGTVVDFTAPMDGYGSTNHTVQKFSVKDHLQATISEFSMTGSLPTTFDSKNPGTNSTWDVLNCTSRHQAGYLIVNHYTRIDKMTVSRVSVKGAITTTEGSAMYWGTCAVKECLVEDCWIQDCDFTKDANGKYDSNSGTGGTVRTIGNTCIKLELDNCYLKNNKSNFNGGGLYFNSNNDDVTDQEHNALLDEVSASVKNCHFESNTAVRDGGGIYCEAKLNVTGCVIHDNTARRGGGIAQQVYTNADRKIQEDESTKLELDSNTSIYDNKAVIVNPADTHVAMVELNAVELASTGGHGGGISITANHTMSLPEDSTMEYPIEFTLGGATVYNNDAQCNGGGIYFLTHTYPDDPAKQAQVDRFYKTININNGSIYGNEAGVGGSGNGGGIYMSAGEPSATSKPAKSKTTLNVSSGFIYKNTAYKGNGGGIYLTGKYATCTVTGGTIGGSTENANIAERDPAHNYTNQTSGCGGGIAISDGAHIDMTVATGATTGGTVSYNQAGFQGGGIWLDNRGTNEVSNSISVAKGTITRNEITATTATSAHGGGVYVGKIGSVSLSGGEISYNTTIGWGGGIYADEGVTLIVTDGHVKNNTADCGGGITLQKWDALTFTGGEVSNNTATANGGGIHVYTACNVTINGGNIQNNKVTGSSGKGGGLYASDSTISILKGIISGNNVSNGNGGGVYAEAKANVTVDGGQIQNNTASSNGGGACVSNANFTIKNGTVSSNYASAGAGIAAFSGATVTVSGGKIQLNGRTSGTGVICTYGGGIYSSASTVSVTNGHIINNKTQRGGGIAVQNSSTVTIEGGYIKNNYASSNGGAIYCNTNSGVTVKNGEITYNESGLKGGGLYVTSGADVTIQGGEVNHNTSKTGGGIYALGNTNFTDNVPDYDTTVLVTGGEICYNTANGTDDTNGQGGGIFANQFVDVQVKRKDANTVGKINYNTAAKGGAVYVNGGAKLTVENGHITRNKAVGTPEGKTTTYLANDGLKGVGGGIYVCNGHSDTVKSQFTLTGTDVAIYGNLADFAADDVFANGNDTKLNVPYVSRMNLSGYARKAEGWFEDYNVNDSKYGVRLGRTTGNTQGNNVRYRGAVASKRIIIPEVWNGNTPNYDEFTANLVDAYVCMTLGIPAAVSDSIVIDYGLPVKVDLMKNDVLVNKGTFLGVGAVPKQNGVFVEYSESKIGSYGSSVTCKYGTATFDGSVLTYTPSQMKMDSHEEFAYAISYQPETADKVYYYYGIVTIIPATNIYYEDNFITYKAYTYIEDTQNKGRGTAATLLTSGGWKDIGNLPENVYQNVDRPGRMNDDDMNNVYGYDSNYRTGTCSIYSLNQTKYIRVSSTPNTASGMTGTNTKIYGTAEFTFKGTGFDLISVTSKNTGGITVQITGVTNSYSKNLLVDTYYGYQYVDTDGDGKAEWVPADTNGTGNNPIYQVPVIKVTDLAYGEYKVLVTASYSKFFNHNEDNWYDFYLDAVRIYDPANNGENANGTVNNSTIQDAYKADNECWPEYQELRNRLISKKTFDSLNGTNTSVTGAVYIDNVASTGKTSIADYTNYGPNNELYLAPSQSVAFHLTPGSNVASIQIGLKSAIKYTYFTIQTTDGKRVGENYIYNSELYYDLTELFRNADGTLSPKTLIITCSNGSNVLSVTNLKITYKSKPTSSDLPTTMSVNHEIGTQVLEYMAQMESEPDPVPPVGGMLDVIGASLSFEDEILTNLYYTASDLEGVAAADMGLLTWSAMPEEATFENAENVFAGASYDADNDRYMVHTDGIAAKKLGDDIYMAVYAKLADGSYVYSKVISYSPKQYAMSRLEKSSDDNLKALCAAMLNYGAAAQTYFGYKTDALMNAELTAEQQALVEAYSADLFNGAVAADPTKVGAFGATESGFGGKSASVSFEGAFAINYYFAPDAAVDGEVTFYYWNADAYAKADSLTVENATGTAAMVDSGNGVYWAQVCDIAAKQLDDTYYVAAVYTSNGETFCTGVIAYSLSTYCMKNAAGEMGALAQATATYGYHAKNYFG